MDEAFAKEMIEREKSELTKATPRLQSVPPLSDPQRRTKQMIEQFAKIKEGLKSELQKIQAERDQLDAQMDDIDLALRVLSSAQAMLDTGDVS